MDVVIGIDASTTGTKAVAFDLAGTEHATGRVAIDRQSPHPAWHEQDAATWWTSTVEALRNVQRELATAGHTVRGIGITHQRESFVCLDEAFEQVRPGILWLDARAGEQVRALGTERVHHLSGKPPSTTPSFYKIAWLREHEPEALARTRYVADVHAYLSLRLTGRFATSLASADPTGMVDLSHGWSDELLGLVGLSREMMPEIVAPGALVGAITPEVAEATGLPTGVPVFGGAGDGQSGGLGAGVSRSGVAYLSLGTSITLGAHAADGAPTTRDYRILASPLGTGVTIEGFVATGALSVSWFRQAFSGSVTQDSNGLESSLADTRPGAGGLRFLPYLSGSATPYWDDKARGAFVGIDESHTAPDFYRAVLEGLALEVGVLLERLESATGRIDEVIVMGGGAVSSGWLGIIANVLDRPLLVSATTEATALGAAILAAHGAGLFPGAVHDAVSAMVHNDSTVVPDPDVAAIYRDAAVGYARLYPTLEPLFREGLVGS